MARILLSCLYTCGALLALPASVVAQPSASDAKSTSDAKPAPKVAQTAPASGAADSSASSGPRNPLTEEGPSAEREPEEPSQPAIDIGVSASLDRARTYYQEGRYDSCAKSYSDLFGGLKNPSREIPAQLLEDARVHHAACLLALGRRDDADKQLRKAMEENPLMASPDPVLFPSAVRDLFFQVKSDFLEEIGKAQEEELKQARRAEQQRQERARQERLRVARLEELASQESLVHSNRRWIAAIPFGVGQFQNGDTALGGLFLTSEVLLLGATIAAVSRQLQVHALADGGRINDPAAFNDPIEFAHRVELWAGGAFLLMAGIGVLEAQLNFVDEAPLGTRARGAGKPTRQKKASTLEPIVSHVDGGGLVGVGGRF